MYNGYILQAKINATKVKHKHVVNFISSGWMKCSGGASYLAMKNNPVSVGKFPCTWVMADKHRWVTVLQYHFQLDGYLNPYNTSLHKSWGVSMSTSSPCGANGTPKNWGLNDSRGVTCLSLKGNLAQVTSNIGDEAGNNKYLRNTIVLE